MLLVEGIFLALPFGQDAREIEGHAAPFTTAVEATLPAPAQGPTAALMPRPPPRRQVRFPGGQASFPLASVQPAAVEERSVRPAGGARQQHTGGVVAAVVKQEGEGAG